MRCGSHFLEWVPYYLQPPIASGFQVYGAYSLGLLPSASPLTLRVCHRFCELLCFPSAGVGNELYLSQIKVSRPLRGLTSVLVQSSTSGFVPDGTLVSSPSKRATQGLSVL